MTPINSWKAFLIPKLRQIVHFLTTLGIATAARLLCGFLCVRLLPISEYAKFAVVYSFLGTLAILMDVSFSGTLIPLVGENTDDLQRIADYTASLRQLAHWIFFAVAPAVVLLYPLLVHKQGWSWRVIAGMIAILLIAGWCDRLGGTYGAVLLVRRDQKTWNKAQMFANFVPLTLVGVLWAARSLNAFSAMLANLTNAVFLAGFYFFRARRLLRINGQASRQKRKEIIHLAFPNMPSAIFYALQGQISILLITVFGRSAAIAGVGALNRLSQVYIVVGLLNPYLIAPYFGRLPEARLKRNYIGVLAIEGALALFVTALARAFPQMFLWVLGRQYSNLRYEVFLAIAGASIAYLSGALSFIHSARRFVYWWNSAAIIILTIVIEGLFIWKANLSTVRGVLYLNLALLAVNFLVNTVTGVYGFICGPRTLAQADPLPAGSPSS
jgi:O-antigen/teichoic acid export membrane protein